jgi:hypothetical protein
LWGIYENGVEVKSKVEEKHSCLMKDVNHWMDAAVKPYDGAKLYKIEG